MLPLPLAKTLGLHLARQGNAALAVDVLSPHAGSDFGADLARARAWAFDGNFRRAAAIVMDTMTFQFGFLANWSVLELGEWLVLSGAPEQGFAMLAAAIEDTCGAPLPPNVEPEALDGAEDPCIQLVAGRSSVEAHRALLAGEVDEAMVAADRAYRLVQHRAAANFDDERRAAALWRVVASWWRDGVPQPSPVREAAWECASNHWCLDAGSAAEVAWLRAVAAEAVGRTRVACAWWLALDQAIAEGEAEGVPEAVAVKAVRERRACFDDPTYRPVPQGNEEGG